MTRCHIRWMIRRDLPQVLAIENASFEYPMTEDDILAYLRERQTIGMVAEQGDRILGFMVYTLLGGRIRVLDFAVHPEHRRQGIGHQMASKLIGKLSPHRRTRITLNVREGNLSGQLFLRSQGFRAAEVLREHYGDTGEDAYAMAYTLLIPAYATLADGRPA